MRAPHPGFARKLSQMRIQLAPIVAVTSGIPAPDYPSTLLNFWLLTEAQLDDLAAFYDQASPNGWTNCYPATMGWDKNASIAVKRRKLGKFIGLRGCETPVEERRQGKKVKDREEDLLWKRKWC